MNSIRSKVEYQRQWRIDNSEALEISGKLNVRIRIARDLLRPERAGVLKKVLRKHELCAIRRIKAEKILMVN